LFTKVSLSYLSVSAFMLILGVLLTNSILFYISLMPLFCVVVGLILNQPSKIEVTRREPKKICFVNETVEVAFKVEVKEGLGILILRDLIPQYFELVEGNNLKIIWKGLKPYSETLSYKIRCTKRGTYELQNLNWESRHVLGLKQTVTGKFTGGQTIEVKIRTLSLRRVRNLKTTTRLPLPMGAFCKAGLSTTDFQEIREYTYGDPYREINWKATARLATGTRSKPFVNEYEREGKKFVWIFIDGSPAMCVHGSAISNTFEHAIAAANNLSQYYLERDCCVGVYLYNKHPHPKLLYPDLGRRQRYKISRELLTADTGPEKSLRESVQQVKPYLAGTNPLCIIITTLSRTASGNVVAGVKELAKYSRKHSRRTANLFVINVSSYPFAAKNENESLGADILETKSLPVRRQLRKTGAIVVDWNPLEQPLAKVLLSEVARR
jgi:uncharacterized protein (DUF58 family)